MNLLDGLGALVCSPGHPIALGEKQTRAQRHLQGSIMNRGFYTASEASPSHPCHLLERQLMRDGGHIVNVVIPAPQVKATCSGMCAMVRTLWYVHWSMYIVVGVLVESGGCSEDLTLQRHE